MLLNCEGRELTSSSEQAIEAIAHFTKLLSTQISPNPNALRAVLIDQSHCLDASLTLHELKNATFNLARNKAPGPDGVPIELYLNLWDSIGPNLLAALQARIASSALHPDITLGLIILLHKKGDLRLLTNKRGLTLLNSTYKILTQDLSAHDGLCYDGLHFSSTCNLPS